MSTLTQETLFGEREVTHGTITVENGDLYPYIRLLSSLVDEVKLDATDSGFYTRAVDPANVGMLEASLQVDHNLPEFTEGVNIDHLKGLLANKKRTATVKLEFSQPYGSLRVSHGDWDIAERVGYIDPDSVRGRPDREPIELDLPVSVEINIPPLASYIASKDKSNGYEFKAEDGELLIGTLADSTDYSSVATTDIPTDESAASMFSGYYLKSVIPTLRSVGVETATINLGNEYPMYMEFETDTITGSFGLAPRVQK